MTILEMSLGGAVLIAVILLLHRLALYRLPKWTFLLLWAVALCRLLVPFTLPSQLSVYTGAARAVRLLENAVEVHAAPSEAQPSVVLPPSTYFGTPQEDDRTASAAPVSASAPETKPFSLLTTVYWTGVALCGLFFAAAYLRGLCRFWEAKLVESDFLLRWQEEHPTMFPVAIKSCAAVNSPLAYGLVRPVVLLPENTDWSDKDQLTYVLTHEYVHIRRGDLFWKWLLTTALCVHWFNPLVWLMYFCANQDLELACDEQVVRSLGLDSRKGYAYSLLAAAESGFSPFCTTYTTQHHVEERICAIMKIKKRSVVAVLAAVLLVSGVTTVFATSNASEPQEAADPTPETPWGVPDGEIPELTEFTVDGPEDAKELGKYLEETHGLYPGDYVFGGGSRCFVQITYTERKIRERLPDGVYPVNSKGETYGTDMDSMVVGYRPDLIAAVATNGERGYVIYDDFNSHFGYPGEINNPDDAMAYMEWLETQPSERLIPVYDANRDNIVGYFAIRNPKK